jgi:hypothetical protein
MKRLSMLAILIFSRTTFAEPTAASEPPHAKSAEARAADMLVRRELTEPLAEKESNRSRFSRARLPAQDRRVRILDDQPRKDIAGDAFVRFAVDARHGYREVAEGDDAGWRLATITGCVYLERSQVFVKQGDQHRPAAILLGKNVKVAAATICNPASAKLAHAD